jgi:hypothetical protein
MLLIRGFTKPMADTESHVRSGVSASCSSTVPSSGPLWAWPEFEMRSVGRERRVSRVLYR